MTGRLIEPDAGWDDDDALDREEQEAAAKVAAELRRHAETKGHQAGLGWVGWAVLNVTPRGQLDGSDDLAFAVQLPGDLKVLVTVEVIP